MTNTAHYNILLYTSAVVYIVIYLIIEIRKRQRIKRFTTVVGIIKDVQQLERPEWSYEEETNPNRYCLIVHYVYEAQNYVLSEDIPDKLFAHQIGKEIVVFINPQDITSSTITQPYDNTEITGYIIKALPVLFLLLLFMYINY